MFLGKLLLKVAVNAASIYIASTILDGVSVHVNGYTDVQSIGILALIGLVIWFGNHIIRPLVKVLTFPLILVTFGLFNIVINMGILWLADIVLPQMEIAGFIPLALTTLIISIINSLLFFI